MVGSIGSADVPLVCHHARVAAALRCAGCGWSVTAGGRYVIMRDVDGPWPGRRSIVRRPPRIADGAMDRSIGP